MTDPSSPPEDRPVPPQEEKWVCPLCWKSGKSVAAIPHQAHCENAIKAVPPPERREAPLEPLDVIEIASDCRFFARTIQARKEAVTPWESGVARLFDKAADALFKLQEGRASSPAAHAERPDIGLSIDMLDADRLRLWAENIEKYGPHIGQWGSCSWVAGEMRRMADCVAQAVKDIGVLRGGR